MTNEYLDLTGNDIRLLLGTVSDEPEHVVMVKPHDMENCSAAGWTPNGYCGTSWEASCSCGFIQGTVSEKRAEAIAERHIDDPTESPIRLSVDRPTVVTIPTKTKV